MKFVQTMLIGALAVAAAPAVLAAEKESDSEVQEGTLGTAMPRVCARAFGSAAAARACCMP